MRHVVSMILLVLAIGCGRQPVATGPSAEDRYIQAASLLAAEEARLDTLSDASLKAYGKKLEASNKYHMANGTSMEQSYKDLLDSVETLCKEADAAFMKQSARVEDAKAILDKAKAALNE